MQLQINAWCINRLCEAQEEFKQEKYYSFKRLRSCEAWVYETDNYYILRSYNTLVAIIDKRTKQLYDVLRYMYMYTATSAQHIAKFRQDYGDTKIPNFTWRHVDLGPINV